MCLPRCFEPRDRAPHLACSGLRIPCIILALVATVDVVIVKGGDAPARAKRRVELVVVLKLGEHQLHGKNGAGVHAGAVLHGVGSKHRSKVSEGELHLQANLTAKPTPRVLQRSINNQRKKLLA